MTTNQTIDGVTVPREMLQKWLDYIGPSRHVTQYAALRREELRALLEAPAPRTEFKKIEMAHVMSALEDVRGKPVLTSNQCHDLARALNDRLLSPLQLLSLPPEYLAAAQPQGEPVAWIVTDMNGDSYFAYDKQTPNDKPLYTEQPAPVAVVLPERRAVSPSSREQAMCANTWNACLDEVTRLNTKERLPL